MFMKECVYKEDACGKQTKNYFILFHHSGGSCCSISVCRKHRKFKSDTHRIVQRIIYFIQRKCSDHFRSPFSAYLYCNFGWSSHRSFRRTAASCDENPLADPGIIGISSGASLTAVLITAFVPALYYFTPLFAFLGGMLAFILVYSLSWKGGLSPVRIILVGVAIEAMLSGIMSAFNSGTGSNYSGVASIVNANISMKTWDDFYTLLWYVLAGLIASFFVAGACNLLALEDKTARSLGVNVTSSRIIISIIGVLLASISTAIIGPISFLGLIVPHIARLLVGSNHKLLIPYSILLGAFTLLLADTLGRTIAAPYEISTSIIMAVIGGPFFIILLRRSRQKYAG